MKSISCLAVFSASLLLASVTHAQQGGNEGGGGHPLAACRNDIQTYCQNTQPGGGRILDCLEDHYKDVSDECYNLLQKAEAHRRNGDAPPPPPRD